MYGYETEVSERKGITVCICDMKWKRVNVRLSQHVRVMKWKRVERKSITVCVGMKLK